MRANDERRTAVGITLDDRAALHDPDVLTVLRAKAVLAHAIETLALEQVHECLARLRPVFRVNQRPDITAYGFYIARLVTVQRVPAVGEFDGIADGTPFPHTLAPVFERELEPLVGGFCIADVGQRSANAGNLALRVTLTDFAAHEKRAVRRIAVAYAVFDRIARRLALETGRHRETVLRNIIRVRQRLELPAARNADVPAEATGEPEVAEFRELVGLRDPLPHAVARVLEYRFELAVLLRQFVARFLQFGDVRMRADEPERAPGGIALRDPTTDQAMQIMPGLMPYALLGIVDIGFSCQHRGEFRAGRLEFVRMDEFREVVNTAPRPGQWVPEQLTPVRRGHKAVVHGIPLPQSLARGFERGAEIGRFLLQTGFRVHELRHIAAGTADEFDPTLAVEIPVRAFDQGHRRGGGRIRAATAQRKTWRDTVSIAVQRGRRFVALGRAQSVQQYRERTGRGDDPAVRAGAIFAEPATAGFPFPYPAAVTPQRDSEASLYVGFGCPRRISVEPDQRRGRFARVMQGRGAQSDPSE